MKSKVALLLTGAALVGMNEAAGAHHSFAMFDSERKNILQGTVQEFQWTNPHAWIMLTVKNGGQPQQWAVEMGGPGNLARQGWSPRSLVRGMSVILTIHPLRDGTNGGQFVDIKLPNGGVLVR
jgi:hypothetical protein